MPQDPQLSKDLTDKINALVPGEKSEARCVVVLYTNPSNKRLHTHVLRPYGVDDKGPNHKITVEDEYQVESANFLRGTGSECISYKVGGKRKVYCW